MRVLRLVLVGGSALLWACASDPAANQPDPCLTPKTYATDVRPIIERACIRCHSEQISGGARNNAPDDINYDRLELFADEAARAAFVDAITSGRQPPPTLTPPLPTTEDERATVSAWQTCGYRP